MNGGALGLIEKGTDWKAEAPVLVGILLAIPQANDDRSEER